MTELGNSLLNRGDDRALVPDLSSSDSLELEPRCAQTRRVIRRQLTDDRDRPVLRAINRLERPDQLLDLLLAAGVALAEIARPPCRRGLRQERAVSRLVFARTLDRLESGVVQDPARDRLQSDGVLSLGEPRH